MTPSHEEAHRFLELARADLDAFRVLAANADIRPAIALFHAQQAAEKSLKAVLFIKGLEFRRTHDLFELAEKLGQAGVALDFSSAVLARLNPYAVSFRYDSECADLLPLNEGERIAAGVIAWAELVIADATSAGGP